MEHSNFKWIEIYIKWIEIYIRDTSELLATEGPFLKVYSLQEMSRQSQDAPSWTEQNTISSLSLHNKHLDDQKTL